jgi:Ca2+-binding EF-hand superfamily protein
MSAFKTYLENITKINLTKEQKSFLKKAYDNKDWDLGNVTNGIQEYLKRTGKKISEDEIKDLLNKNILKLVPKYDSKRNKFTHLQIKKKASDIGL